MEERNVYQEKGNDGKATEAVNRKVCSGKKESKNENTCEHLWNEKE